MLSLVSIITGDDSWRFSDDLFVCTAALFAISSSTWTLALAFIRMTVTAVNTTTHVTNSMASEMVEIKVGLPAWKKLRFKNYRVLHGSTHIQLPFGLVCIMTWFKLLITISTVSFKFLITFPQTTVRTANVHMSPSVGTSVQVTVVWVVVMGQLPQFDDRM